MKCTKRHDINIICGDFNAKIGNGRVENIVGDYGLGRRNARGDKLVQFCQEAEMVITNTWFALPLRRLYTWTPGPDDMRSEFPKILGEGGIKTLTRLYNMVYRPEEWLNSIFVTLPKKANARRCSEYRTLSVMSHVLKTFLRIIYERIKNKCEEYISDTQFGFRAGTGTREALLSVTVLAEKCLDMNHDLYICFINFEKAFNEVQHQKLIEILQQLGLDGRDIHIIKHLYWRQKARVRVGNQTTDEVQINRGGRQGCIPSQILFNVYSERIIENALTRPEGIKINGVLINNILYANDTALIAGTEEDLQILLDRVTAECNNRGLKTNTTKTKVMVISKNNVQTNIISDNVRINQVHTHRYLTRWTAKSTLR
jgi:hypothetical protein